MMLRGLRGAITVKQNTGPAILEATQALLGIIQKENQLQLEDIASIFFSVTPDLNADFPAKAAREIGFSEVPLMCMVEIPVPNSLPYCIRILMHVNTLKKQADMLPIYLRGASVLRPEHDYKG